jgi:hypothetical protein
VEQVSTGERGERKWRGWEETREREEMIEKTTTTTRWKRGRDRVMRINSSNSLLLSSLLAVLERDQLKLVNGCLLHPSLISCLRRGLQFITRRHRWLRRIEAAIFRRAQLSSEGLPLPGRLGDNV